MNLNEWVDIHKAHICQRIKVWKKEQTNKLAKTNPIIHLDAITSL